MIILDMGAGDATKNDLDYVREIMSELPKGVTVKFQLFTNIPGLTPLDRRVFMGAAAYGSEIGIDVTASAFDIESLEVMTKMVKVPFIKIACRPEMYPLIDNIPMNIPVVVSCDSHIQMLSVATEHMQHPIAYMCCVPEYPAQVEQYHRGFAETMLRRGISDHTMGLELWQQYKPDLYERHLDFEGPDQEHSISVSDVHWMVKHADD